MVNDIPIMFARPGDFVVPILNIACLISSTRASKWKHLSPFGINLATHILSFYPKSLHLGCLSKSVTDFSSTDTFLMTWNLTKAPLDLFLLQILVDK